MNALHFFGTILHTLATLVVGALVASGLASVPVTATIATTTLQKIQIQSTSTTSTAVLPAATPTPQKPTNTPAPVAVKSIQNIAPVSTPPTGVTTNTATTLQMKTECATLGLQKENSDKTTLIGTESIIRDAYGYSPSLDTCVYAAEYEFPILNTIDASFSNLTTGTDISLPESGSWSMNTRTLPVGEFNYNGWVYDCNSLPGFINTGNQIGQSNWVSFNTGQSCGTVWVYTPGIDTTRAVKNFNAIPYDYTASVDDFWAKYSTLVPQ